jgi:hypothetical protein
MIRSLFFLYFFVSVVLTGHSQSTAQPRANPSLPGYSGFHSNLGIQEIIEVGIPLQESDPISKTDADRESTATAAVQSSSLPTKGKTESLKFSTQAGIRAYSTSNVLRQDSSLAQSSGVFESSLGVGLSQDAYKVTDYMTMLPRLDLMMQWAWYDKSSELLNYRFGLLKGGIAFGFPDNWSVGTSIDYNTLNNLETGDKSFDSISPSVSLQKIFPTSETSFFMFDTMVRWSNMDTTISFPAAGIFPDSTDNHQTSFSITYIKILGAEQEWTIMPRVSINRTNYTKDPNTGRLDYLFNGGLSAIYNLNDWFSVQGFGTYNKMNSDDDTVPDFKAFDTGVSMNANYRF